MPVFWNVAVEKANEKRSVRVNEVGVQETTIEGQGRCFSGNGCATSRGVVAERCLNFVLSVILYFVLSFDGSETHR